MSVTLGYLQREAAARSSDETAAKREMIRASYRSDELAYKAARARWESALKVAQAADKAARDQYEAENGK